MKYKQPSLAAVTSFVRRAITRHAASCWYKAWDNSKRYKRDGVIFYNTGLPHIKLKWSHVRDNK